MFLLCLPAPSACPATGLPGQVVTDLEQGLAEGTVALPSALGRVKVEGRARSGPELYFHQALPVGQVWYKPGLAVWLQ